MIGCCIVHFSEEAPQPALDMLIALTLPHWHSNCSRSAFQVSLTDTRPVYVQSSTERYLRSQTCSLGMHFLSLSRCHQSGAGAAECCNGRPASERIQATMQE